jgi:HSP20 family molecular chaperone IbpA
MYWINRLLSVFSNSKDKIYKLPPFENSNITIIDLPGFHPDSINVEVVDDILVIRASKSGVDICKKYKLPYYADCNSIKAELYNGELTIFIYRRPRKISIHIKNNSCTP